MKRILVMLIVIAGLLSCVQANCYSVGNSVEAMYEEGIKFFEKEDYDRAFARFQISGEVKGYAPVQNMLGVCYRDGLGTEQDIAEAEKCFRLSAEQGYAPAKENLTALVGEQKSEKEKTAKESNSATISEGDYVTFGSYEQDNNLTNGPEPIEWLVLDVQEGKALLISKLGLDCQPYNSIRMGIPWEDCSLRTWMNNTFFNTAFLAGEQEQIVATYVIPEKPRSSSRDLVNIPHEIEHLDRAC